MRSTVPARDAAATSVRLNGLQASSASSGVGVPMTLSGADGRATSYISKERPARRRTRPRVWGCAAHVEMLAPSVRGRPRKAEGTPAGSWSAWALEEVVKTARLLSEESEREVMGDFAEARTLVVEGSDNKVSVDPELKMTEDAAGQIRCTMGADV
jgi:hypothetical protein